MFRFRKGVLLLLVLLACLIPGCRPEESPDAEPEGGRQEDLPELEETGTEVTLTYLGHSTFLIDCGLQILIDPYSPRLGYGSLDLETDLVTVSHDHFDHNYIQGAGSSARVLKGLTVDGDWKEENFKAGSVNIYSVGTYHDNRNGDWLGKNSIFVFQFPGLRLAHLGDLGHPLSDEQAARLGKIDLLLVPVGGYYTLPLEEIPGLINRLKPKVVIPMHYRTDHNRENLIGSLEDFQKTNPPYPFKVKKSTVTLSSDSLPRTTEIWAMEYSSPE
ncbi:MAG TPA: MBL fold metallo-hydrolase [Bacillota bacterium]|jgi:L-ascorbate metabolism protein UlaG (beta-lactamase superfamily)|nr:MBL fold metallo-hydrolase [Bacillota bacterium]HOB87654.1 MBL fold metallo-hydrolase [Bacillota bacterium]HOP69357.1 MBL fold metallo-hydrolase [Bacillota bacterium]HPT33700.1 MBL fold metallo-hydrolase [Bacillota bacterium]HQD05735.1 MBL fold metallo-hydrolase [Bacillota bacterium]